MAVIRHLYRTIIPRAIRTALRARFAAPRPPPAPRPKPRPAEGPRRFRLPMPVSAPLSEAQDARRSLAIEAPSRLYVTGELHRLGVGGYEPETVAILLGVAETVRPSVVFDIGSSVGPHALLLPALLGVRVVAFEPTPDVAAALRHLVSINDLPCTVEEIALGDVDGTAMLLISSTTDVSNSLRPGFRAARSEVSVAVRRLDTFVRETGLRPTLIKIDTETTEPAVLRGAPDLLASRPWIVCEVLPGWTETDLEGLLQPHDYALYLIDDELPLPRRDRILGHTTGTHRNWLFAPEEPSAGLWEAVTRWRRAIDATPTPHAAGSDPATERDWAGTGARR